MQNQRQDRRVSTGPNTAGMVPRDDDPMGIKKMAINAMGKPITNALGGAMEAGMVPVAEAAKVGAPTLSNMAASGFPVLPPMLGPLALAGIAGKVFNWWNQGTPNVQDKAQIAYDAVTGEGQRTMRSPMQYAAGTTTAEDEGRVKPGAVYTQQMPDTKSAVPAFNDLNFIQSGEYVIPPQGLGPDERGAHINALKRRFLQQEEDLREAQDAFGLKGPMYSGTLDALHDATQRDTNLINRYGVDGQSSAYNARSFGSNLDPSIPFPFMPGVSANNLSEIYPGGTQPGHFTPNPEYKAFDRMYPAPGYRDQINDMVAGLNKGTPSVPLPVDPFAPVNMYSGGTHKVAGIDPQKYSRGSDNIPTQLELPLPPTDNSPFTLPLTQEEKYYHRDQYFYPKLEPWDPVGPLSDRQMKNQLHQQKMGHNEQRHRKQMMTT